MPYGMTIDELEQRIVALEEKLNPPPLVATTLGDQEVEKRIAALEIALEAVTADHRRIWGALGGQREVNKSLAKLAESLAKVAAIIHKELGE